MKAVLIKQKSHPSIPRRSPLERIAEEISRHTPELIVAPEYFLNNERRIYTRQEKEELVRKVADIAEDRLVVPGTILWQEDGLMRNTAVAVSNGKVLAEHDKSTDGGEALIAQTYGLSPFYGEWEACVFPWKGLDVSLEICMEHGDKLLKETGKRADLQIIAGNGAKIRPHALHLKNKGYALVCDGQRTRTCEAVRKRFPGFYNQIEGRKTDNVFTYELFPEGR
ncbi:MAG: hypothetical protein V1734_07140 [Nanoarchaeota archaeon]